MLLFCWHVAQYYCPDEPDADDLFIFYRFLLPQNDTERKAYGAKEAILAKEIGKAIDAPREMQISMKDYRNSKRPGHFPLTVHWVAQRYMDDNPTSNATLGDVDAALDEIANNQIASENSQMSRSDAIFTALRRICDKISPDDLFWIVRPHICNFPPQCFHLGLYL